VDAGGGDAAAADPRPMRLRAAILLVVGIAGCALFRAPDRTPEIAPALADLAAAGFVFAPDVRLRNDPRAVCDGLACADLVVENERRIILSPTARSPAWKLRATLLEIWVRYQTRATGTRDLARACRQPGRPARRRHRSRRPLDALRLQAAWELSADKRTDLPDRRRSCADGDSLRPRNPTSRRFVLLERELITSALTRAMAATKKRRCRCLAAKSAPRFEPGKAARGKPERTWGGPGAARSAGLRPTRPARRDCVRARVRERWRARGS
jgi:hypothetical protein